MPHAQSYIRLNALRILSQHHRIWNFVLEPCLSIMRKSNWSLSFYPELSVTSLTIRTRSCSVWFVFSHPLVTLNHPSCQCKDIYHLLLSLLCWCSKFICCLLPLGLCNTFSALVPPATFFLLEPSKVYLSPKKKQFPWKLKNRLS